MGTFIAALGLTLTYLIFTAMSAPTSIIFNVMDFGAVGDGKADDSKALLKAWGTACGSNAEAAVIIIPSGQTLLLGPLVELNGPCKAPKIRIAILGSLVAPSPYAWNGLSLDYWLVFRYVNGLILSGNGEINGRGAAWWSSLCKTNSKQGCIRRAPMTLSMLSCNDVEVYGLNFVDSPFFHMHLWDCSRGIISGLNIRAPEESPDTAGIHLAACTSFRLDNLTIGTGDDCVTIDDQSSNVFINKMVCGPGHGISIGSLGRNHDFASVEDIYVRSVIFYKSENGARIKTWQGGKGYARNITFTRMTFVEVNNPIIIDQYYCGGGSGCRKQSDAVKISDVRFIDASGTSRGYAAPISLMCSENVPCTELMLRDIKITPAKRLGETSARCINAQGSSTGEVVPQVPCLS